MEFNFLYFFQFLPVVIFQIPIGFLIDKYPLKRTLFFFCFLSFGAILFSGIVFEFMIPGYKWIINIVRAGFGVCGEALFTVQAVILTYFAKENY
jgi:MFS family permease